MMAALNTTQLRGKLAYQEMMSRHTTWRVGGPADVFYTPADYDDLAEFLRSLDAEEEIYFLGLGSNLLVRDKGIRGTVISLKGSGLAEIKILSGTRIQVGAGVSCAKLARFCHRNNLQGGEFFAGIPGLLGGALAMNAGAFSGETWKQVKYVVSIDREGNLHRRSPEEYEVTYRSVKGPQDEWFVGAELEFSKGDGEVAALQVKQLLEKRAKTQPTGLPSCGSVFKNPEGDFAARLIEACDLKGYKIGGAEVSAKHANFIINADNASAADIEALIEYVQKTVKQQKGIELKAEAKIIGETDNEKL